MSVPVHKRAALPNDLQVLRLMDELLCLCNQLLASRQIRKPLKIEPRTPQDVNRINMLLAERARVYENYRDVKHLALFAYRKIAYANYIPDTTVCNVKQRYWEQRKALEAIVAAKTLLNSSANCYHLPAKKYKHFADLFEQLIPAIRGWMVYEAKRRTKLEAQGKLGDYTDMIFLEDIDN